MSNLCGRAINYLLGFSLIMAQPEKLYLKKAKEKNQCPAITKKNLTTTC
jgi:hypothetical protein